MDRPYLDRLSRKNLIELALRLQHPDKTSRTSSKLPSSDHEERREGWHFVGTKPGHKGSYRTAEVTVNLTIHHRLGICTRCAAVLVADLPDETVSEHNTVELPPVRPMVERHRRLAICCSSCGKRVVAAMPPAANTRRQPASGKRSQLRRNQGAYRGGQRISLGVSLLQRRRPSRLADLRRDRGAPDDSQASPLYLVFRSLCRAARTRRYALQPTIFHLTRSLVHPCLQRHGISRLPNVNGDHRPRPQWSAR